MIQKLRNAVVAPTGMGKNYGRIMPLLRQGWLVRQKIMHYGFFGQCFSGCLCSQEETSQLQPILLFWKIPLGTIIKLPIYPSAAVAASSSNPRDIQLVVHLFSSQHTGSYTAQHYLKFKGCRRIW